MHIFLIKLKDSTSILEWYLTIKTVYKQHPLHKNINTMGI